MPTPNPATAHPSDARIASSNDNGQPRLEFWFEFASTYSYLAAMRVETIALDANIKVAWRPFLLGPIFKRQGWDTSPFNIQAAKGRYMWRDMERQCERFSLPFSRPYPFPQQSLQATRIAHAARDQHWVGGFIRAVFMAEFGHGMDISEEGLMADLLLEAGAPARQALEDATSPENKSGLRETVEKAEDLGIFGAPSFITPGGDLFWGNDRLEEAVEATAKTVVR
jgi:2-hydroxychromene-2-carboxylate isomerase